MLLLLVIVRTSTTAKKINMDGTNHVPLKNDGEQQPNAPQTLFLPLTQKAHPWAQLNKTMPQCPMCLSVIPSFHDHSCPSDATPRTDAFCAALKGIGNWERWQKTAAFAADLERELATVRRDLRGLMDEYADRRAQWGDEYLWGKHEDTELVEDIRRRILENADVDARMPASRDSESITD